jgi:hypothetical protein
VTRGDAHITSLLGEKLFLYFSVAIASQFVCRQRRRGKTVVSGSFIISVRVCLFPKLSLSLYAKRLARLDARSGICSSTLEVSHSTYGDTVRYFFVSVQPLFAQFTRLELSIDLLNNKLALCYI